MLVKLPKSFAKRGVHKVFTDEDAEKFLNGIAKRHKQDKEKMLMLQAVMIVMYRTGARISEIVFLPESEKHDFYKYGLFYDDFAFTDDYVIIKLKTAKKKTKDNIGMIRYVWLPSADPLIENLLLWRLKKKPGDPLFPVHRATVWLELKKVAIDLGYEPEHFWLHYLRGSSFSNDGGMGATNIEITAKAGWSSFRYADDYVATDINTTRGIAERLKKHQEQIMLEKKAQLEAIRQARMGKRGKEKGHFSAKSEKP